MGVEANPSVAYEPDAPEGRTAMMPVSITLTREEMTPGKRVGHRAYFLRWRDPATKQTCQKAFQAQSDRDAVNKGQAMLLRWVTAGWEAER